MNKRWLLILIICLLSTSLAASAWLFYQNLQLRQQIASLQTQPLSSSVETPAPSVNPTANWEIFTDKFTSFTFKYPPTLSNITPDTKLPHAPYGNLSTIKYLATSDGTQLILSYLSDFVLGGKPCGNVLLKENIQVGSMRTTKTITNPTTNNECFNYTTDQEIEWVKIKTADINQQSSYDLQFSYPKEQSSKNRMLFDQILSTFQFTD